MAREAMDVCLRVLKESNKSRFDSYRVKNKCIDHNIPYSFCDNLSRNSCIHNTQSEKQVFFLLEFVNILIQMEAKPVKN